MLAELIRRLWCHRPLQLDQSQSSVHVDAVGVDVSRKTIQLENKDTLGYDRTPVRAFASLQRLWRVVRADLHRITAPVLMFRSVEDHVVEPLSGALLLRGATSTTVREVRLENSYHVATMDHDAPLIFDGSMAFIREYADVVSRAS